MAYVAEFIGGPCDGRLEAVVGRPEALFVPVRQSIRLYTEDKVPDSSIPRDLCYVRRIGLDGELRYVWNKLRP